MHEKEKIAKCIQIIEEIGGEIDGEVTNNVISVDDNSWTVLVEEENINELSLSFHIDMPPNIAANTAILLSKLALTRMNMEVVVYGCYSYLCDEEGKVIKMLFDEECYQNKE